MSGSSFSSAEEKLEWFMARDAVEVSMSEERQDLGNNWMLSWCRALQSPNPEGCCYPTHELLGLEVCTEKQTCGNVPVPWGDKGGLWGAAVVPLAQGGLKGHVGRMTTLSYFSMPSTEGREKRIFHLKMDI